MTVDDEPDRSEPGRLVLASASPRRSRLLDELGLAFDVIPADIDERWRDDENPSAYVSRLAAGKAEAVRDRLVASGGAGDRLRVIGADTIVVDPDGEVLGKPVDADDARRMLRLLSDCQHQVLTGIAVATPDAETLVQVERTVVRFVELDDERIDAYLETGEPFDAAGSYAIQGGAGAFVSRIEGSFDNVVGLPVHRVADLLDRV